MPQQSTNSKPGKPPLLVFPRLGPEERSVLATLYSLTILENGIGLEQQDRGFLAGVRCVITTGPVGFRKQMFDLCPNMEAVISFGAGYDQVDLDFARQRGVLLATGAGANANCVAEHAMALLLSLIRRVPHLDRHVRQGEWKFPDVSPQIFGRKLGLLGYGAIGREIARMAQGFNMEIAYTARGPKPDVPYSYFPSARDLAAFCDVLMVVCSGGAETRHLVDADVLTALGPRGVVVNVARGSVIDTEALVEALQEGIIWGAALDVFEKEPHVPDVFKSMENVILTPHMAGGSPDSRRAMLAMAKANVDAFFNGRTMPGLIDYRGSAGRHVL